MPDPVDDYIAAQPLPVQTRLRELRACVRAAAPDANEVISYGMPTYKLPTGGFMSIGAAKRHVALYGADMSAVDLSGYSTSKGTVRFPLDRPIPVELVRSMVLARVTRKA